MYVRNVWGCLNSFIHSRELCCNRLGIRVGQNRTYIRIYGVYTVIFAGELPYTRSYTVYIYGSSQLH